MIRVGILTGGGDCPGLNAVIMGAVRKAQGNSVELIGIKNGWKGLVNIDTVGGKLNVTAVCRTC